MKVKLLGKRKVDYMSKKTNKQVIGIDLHVTCERNDVEGLAVESIFISEKHYDYEKVLGYPIGSDLSVSYNRFGSIDSVILCK